MTPGASGAPVPELLADTAGGRDTPSAAAHGCWYPSADPLGRQVAFICDRGGVPQLWAGPPDAGEARLLDTNPEPVTEVSWSPDGRWIAYTVAPGGSGHTRVLCVRPDGSGRRVVAGAVPGSSAHLGCWTRDGAALAVTVAEPVGDAAPAEAAGARADEAWTHRDGTAVLLDDAHAAQSRARHPGGAPAGVLSAYLVDPDGARSPVLLATEQEAATLRVCDLTPDGRLALLRRGPRGRRRAVVWHTADRRATCTLAAADGDPWIGRFSADGRTAWLRSDHDREFAALMALGLDEHGEPAGLSVAAEREGSDMDLLAFPDDGRAAVSWNAAGAGELETLALDGDGPARPIALEHEVVTRVAPAGPSGMLLALSGSQRRPGIWLVPPAAPPARTPWSSRDEDTVPPGRPPVRPTAQRPTARDGLRLGGWYYRAPGRGPGDPAPCVVHLHGGPEEQERPVFDPLYHELLGRGLDVFAPDVRGSSGWGRSFVDADLGTGRFAAIDDVADCAAHAVTSGLADPTRLAVMGHSYGGYLTLASLVHHPDLFRTGITVCGMSDLGTFFEGTEPWLAESAAHKYGHPERDRELLRALSPMSRVDALRVPLLAVHGEHDTNVPPQESRQIVRAAKQRGLAAELLVLPDEGHDFRHGHTRRLFRRTAADWMQRHLTGAAEAR
ncbi:S9 family peptidase [Streptomyces sp. t39]|uniref:S9 family peptidase n=1 Tax=Streptomyces sp. t39 TaxID=1828156 RepID=UPI0011CEC922|nr:alpha/beta fold hydrolase [Streptomyces sp. t39]TXS52304.1 S9 family peptidase [Streptomyces sp. t39]